MKGITGGVKGFAGMREGGMAFNLLKTSHVCIINIKLRGCVISL